MKLSKTHKSILIVSGIVIIGALSALFFIIPYYRRKKLMNPALLSEAIKLAPNLDVIHFLKNLGLSISKMTNSEINDVYKFVYYYAAKRIPAPESFIERMSELGDKYNLFPNSNTGRKNYTCWNGHIFYNGLVSNKEC